MAARAGRRPAAARRGRLRRPAGADPRRPRRRGAPHRTGPRGPLQPPRRVSRPGGPGLATAPRSCGRTAPAFSCRFRAERRASGDIIDLRSRRTPPEAVRGRPIDAPALGWAAAPASRAARRGSSRRARRRAGRGRRRRRSPACRAPRRPNGACAAPTSSGSFRTRPRRCRVPAPASARRATPCSRRWNRSAPNCARPGRRVRRTPPRS